jgi:ribosomal protein S18 acetylase RimI-like enzyme
VSIGRRAALESDVPFLLQLRRQTMDEHLAAAGASTSDGYHLRALQQHFEQAEVLLNGSECIGLLKVLRTLPCWEILQLQVASAYQGRGVGRSVLNQLIREAGDAGASLSLGVLKANPARRLYERLGFEIVGEDALEYTMQRRR